MKKYILVLLALAAGASLNAWHRGGRWGGWGPGWGGGWGWGPSVGFTVPLGSSSPKYIMPTNVGDPYSQYVSLFPKANPMKNPNSYYQWLVRTYPRAQADQAWNNFVANYNAYQASKPRSSGYFSVGVGGGWGGPWWGW